MVRPGRVDNKRKAIRERWWQFAEKRPGMREALRDLAECVVVRQSSDALAPTLVPTDQVIDQTVIVIATSSRATLAVLSSAAHQYWVIQYGLSTMGGVARYTPSNVFETFPRPAVTQWLEQIGRSLYEERRAVMLRRDLGLTTLYTRVNNPGIDDSADADVARLRALHAEAGNSRYGCLWMGRHTA